MRRLALLLVAALGLCVTPAGAADRQPDPRIVGGAEASAGEYPWQAAMMTARENQYCGGTVIGPSHVLTADHCSTVAGHKVRVGSLDRDAGGQVRTIDGVRRHPLAQGSADPPRYDVRVVHLDSPLPTSAVIGAIATPAQQAGWTSETRFLVSGWGGTYQGDPNGTDLLRWVEVPWVSDAACAAAYPGDFHADDMVCAGDLADGGEDTCQGDSGGPMVAPAVASAATTDATQWILAGATSWGIGCAQAGLPGVYARLGAPEIRDWLALTPPVSGGAPALTGTPVLGEILTCTPSWSGGSAYLTQRFWRTTGTATVLAAEGTSRTYRATAADVGSRISCDATAVNAVASQTSARSASLEILASAPPPPPPPPAPPAEDVLPPGTSETSPAVAAASLAPEALPSIASAVRRCTRRRRCSFTIRPSATTTAIRATLQSTVRRRCGRRSCSRTTRRTLRVRRTATGFRIAPTTLARGRHVLTLVAVDGGGRTALRAYRLRFSLR